MEPIRERIEDFIRRYWYEGNWVFRVLAVAVATLLALLVLRRLRVLAVAPVLIGAILVAGWLLVGTLKTSVLIPRYLDFPPTARW